MTITFRQITSILFFSFLITACNKENINDTLIIGKWQGVHWQSNGTEINDAKATTFSFDANKSYTYTYAGTEEKGTYRIEKNKLYTTPEGKVEIMVSIAKLTADTLIFDMNRGGQAETLTLVKSN